MRAGKGQGMEGEEDEVCCIYTHEDTLTYPAKHSLKEQEEGEGNGNSRRGEIVQGTLSTCVDMSQ
jgi:hypothetical protein